MKGNNEKKWMGKWKWSTEEDKKTWLCHSVSDKRRDRIIETKNKGDHVGLAIAYWLLPTTLHYPTIAMLRIKSLFLR